MLRYRKDMHKVYQLLERSSRIKHKRLLEIL